MSIQLDEHQMKAVRHLDGPALVVAGPGSGKTTVIIERILNLIREHNVDPELILAIAFTNAAVDTMKDRVNSEILYSQDEPKICTLHVFGKDLITDHYLQVGFRNTPMNVWDSDRIGQIINQEKYRFRKSADTRRVCIYKFEGMTNHQCYIGQTTDPDRRELEHRTYSSNRRLRDALSKGSEEFRFSKITSVDGEYADMIESEQIRIHRNRAVVILDEMSEMVKENRNGSEDFCVFLYRIKSKRSATLYYGLSTDPEQRKELHFTDSPNELFHNAIENEDIDLSSFEVIAEAMSWDDANRHLERAVLTHKKWTVFNEEDPLYVRDSTRRRIEVFCDYFSVPYHEVLEHTQKFRHEMHKFAEMKEGIEKEKRKVKSGVFQPEEIADPILRAFAIKYEERKTEAKAIDFPDMLILSANMLEKNEVLLQEYRQKFQYVFVDEFQDISPADFRLIKLFPDNLFAVGDDDQAIYGFRGGDSKIMQKDFANWENTKEYKITRNYRSSSNIVIHSKALIENNLDRISKNLCSYTSEEGRISYLDSSNVNLFQQLLREISAIVESNYQRASILARNWKGEINKIQRLLDCDKLRMQGFDIEWEESEDLRDESDVDDEANKRKLFLRKNSKVIEVMNIFAAKGREWDKVILLVNTCYESLPRPENDTNEERRIFYVAATRAKHELVVFDGGNCPFVAEFQKLPHSERKLQLQKFQNHLLSVFRNRLTDAKEQLCNVSENLYAAFDLQRERLEAANAKVLCKNYETKLEHRRKAIIQTNNITKKIKSTLPQQLNKSREKLLPELIPVLDQLELVIKDATETIETTNLSNEFTKFCEKIHSTQEQFLDLLKNHGLNPIDTLGRTLNLHQHEEIQARVYSNEVPEGKIVKETQRGYFLHDKVIQKAKVIISKGVKPWATEQLMQIVEIYLDRLIHAFQNKYQLNNIDKSFVIQEMEKYISELKDDSIEEIISFASIDKAKAIEIRRLTDYCAGLEKIHLCTAVFQDFWNKIWEELIFLSEKNRNQADLLLSQEFEQPIRFVTYKGFYDLTCVETFPDRIKGIDQQRSEQTIEKSIILFAFPKLNMKALKPNIKRDLHIVDQRLKPIERVYERVPVPDNNQKSYIQLVTRSGHVMKGCLLESDINYLYMKINDTVVIVYRDGILQFKNMDWDEIVNAYEKGRPILGLISERINGGFRVQFGSLIGFLPDSKIEMQAVQNLDRYVGKTYEMKISKCDKRQNNLVFSRCAWLEVKRSEFFENLEIGQKVKGIVKNIKNFGVFVDLGTIDGLIHKTELSWKHINNPSEVISVGDELEIMVITIDRDAEKISLSLKRMTQDPWKDVEKKYPIDSTVQGTINRIEDYGVFLELEEGVVGLIHKSEISFDNRNVVPSEYFSIGDMVNTKVLDISGSNKKISLSLIQSPEKQLELLQRKY